MKDARGRRDTLILSIVSFLALACAVNQDKNKNEAISIELSATYTNLELFNSIRQTDSLLSPGIQAEGDPGSSHPLMRLLRPNIYQDDAGSFFLANAVFIGFAAAKDTTAVIGYLRNSPFLPDSIAYEWSLIGAPAPEYGLIAHRPREMKIILLNEDIESISIEQGNMSTASGLKGLMQAGSGKMLRIRLNESGKIKIKELLTTDALFLKTNIGNRTFVDSQSADALKDGILITDNLSKSFLDTVRQMYPTLMNQE